MPAPFKATPVVFRLKSHPLLNMLTICPGLCRLSGYSNCSESERQTLSTPSDMESSCLTQETYKTWCRSCTKFSSSSNRQTLPSNTFFLRINCLLTIGAFLLSIVHIPTCLSSPISRRSSMDEQSSTERPLWINPCGTTENYKITEESELLHNIITNALTALGQAKHFRENYVKKTFNIDLQSHHQAWGFQRYDWLPTKTEIPKSMGKTLEEIHFNDLEVKTTLKNTYTYLQKIAMGLEQVVLDKPEENLDFKIEFQQAENFSRQVLCEIQIAMHVLSVEPPEDIQRDMMPGEFRRMGKDSVRDVRDWVIFRDYMNALEYVIEVFQHLKNKTDQLAAATKPESQFKSHAEAS